MRQTRLIPTLIHEKHIIKDTLQYNFSLRIQAWVLSHLCICTYLLPMYVLQWCSLYLQTRLCPSIHIKCKRSLIEQIIMNETRFTLRAESSYSCSFSYGFSSSLTNQFIYFEQLFCPSWWCMEQLVDGFINELLDRWLDSWSSFPYDCTVQWEMNHNLLGFFCLLFTNRI